MSFINAVKYPIRYVGWLNFKRTVPKGVLIESFDDLVASLKKSGQLKFLGWWKGKNGK